MHIDPKIEPILKKVVSHFQAQENANDFPEFLSLQYAAILSMISVDEWKGFEDFVINALKETTKMVKKMIDSPCSSRKH